MRPAGRPGEDLYGAREQLRLAVEATGTGIFDYDVVTGTLEWDARTRALYGLPPDAPVSYDVFLAGLHPEDRGWVDAAVRVALDPAGDGTYDIAFRVIGLGDGVERWVAAQGQAFVADGRTVRFVGTTRDVTESRRAEQALREAEERYRLAARATNDAIWDWNLGTDHILWNEAVQALFGYAAEEVGASGAWWTAHIHPDDRGRVTAGIHAVIDGTATGWKDEYRFQRAGGTYAAVLDRTHALDGLRHCDRPDQKLIRLRSTRRRPGLSHYGTGKRYQGCGNQETAYKHHPSRSPIRPTYKANMLFLLFLSKAR